MNNKNLRHELKYYDWGKYHAITNMNDVVNYLIENLKSLVNKNTYTKRHNRKETKRKPWITVGLINFIYKRERLYKNCKDNPNSIEIKLQYTKFT